MKLGFRENWRIWLLILFVLVSTVAIFAPLGGGSDAPVNGTDDGAATQSTASEYTNLQFGLRLSGGTEVQAPLVGMTAENQEFDREEAEEIQSTVEAELGLEDGDVAANPQTGTVEVYADRFIGNVTRAEFAAALQAAGLSASEDDIRMGVTASTRQDTVRVLDNRISQSGLSGATVTERAVPGGQRFISVEVPGASRQQVINFIGDRGRVETVALYPVRTENGTEYRTTTVATQEDIRNVGNARRADENNPRPSVSVTLTDAAASEFQADMQEYGFAQQGGTRCSEYNRNATLEENVQQLEQSNVENRCLLTVRDGEVVFAARVTNDLAESFRTGQFEESPVYASSAGSYEQVQELEINLKTGALETDLDIQNRGRTSYLQPSLAQQFKPLSVLTGAAAVLAVSLMIFFRYRRPDVAAPMILTAAAEVYILLGFAAAVGLPLELSHIAGFIAVIGTGVDDLVIIADEIMQQGEVQTARIFESRFRKAFWVIGAAAATTVIAMSPLAVLSLGDLTGFAIVTIVGVLIGVLITRPAYGDILRVLVLRRE
ncbi:preprotein translocase subunit SecD [Halobacteriales archaeon QS_1_68_44]|nr:MAG: preprotein translocase subunit SecD [Halobacteriales archaeon QS_1_68_44]